MSKSERGGATGTGGLDYLDFELEIGPGSGREYPVAVVRSPAGEARETMRFPYDELTLDNRILTLEKTLLRSGGTRRRAPSAEEKVVEDFGRDLFDTLLSGEVRSRYDVSQQEAARQGKGLRLKLRIQEPDLAALPWEFLYDPRQAEYVCLSRNTPVVRYLELPQPIQPLVVAPPLRILGMIASPRDLPELDVARERGRVERAIQDLGAQGLVELHWMEGQTWRDLQRAMRRGPWHVFHFIGHGGFDRAADEGFVALADREGETYRLSATQLGRLLADHRWLRLVLLNACEGARGSKRDIFSSTATILVRRGIPAVLAMQYEITDRAAIEFARAFYEALADEDPIDAAVSEARKAVILGVANTLEWGTPVLYMRSPDGVLFSIQEAEARAVQEKEPEPRAEDKVARPEPARLRERRAEPAVEIPAPTPARLAYEPEMVLIPGGEFLMGSDMDEDEDAYDDELPQHSLTLADYYLSKTPVTNAQYAAFVEASGHEPPEHWSGRKPPRGEENHPVVWVSWHDAVVYCEWLSEVTGKRYRLPSEAEWEKGARGVDGRIYPWGDEWDPRRCNWDEDEDDEGDTTPVGSYPRGASPYGLLDMAGNVWEWTRSLWGEDSGDPDFDYPYDAADGREDLAVGDDVHRVCRGGAFDEDQDSARCAYRDYYYPEYSAENLGFRVEEVATRTQRLTVEKTGPLARRLAHEPELVLIPGGEFLMGSDLDEDEDAFDDELPQHRLTLADYYLSKTPVTNAQYAAFVQASGHEPPEHWSGRKPPRGEENHPVVWVSWYDAVVYCEWLSDVTGKRYRLPSEAEWEKGARGADGRIYPWGDEWDPERCNWGEDDDGDTTPVGSYLRGASPYGLLDMAGNVWEWTRSLWGDDSEEPDYDYPYDAADGREDLAAGDEVYRVCRGGAFDEDQDSFRCAYRDYYYPEYSAENLGFRVAVASA